MAKVPHYSYLYGSFQQNQVQILEQGYALKCILFYDKSLIFLSSSEWTTKKSFINQTEPGVGRGDGGLDRRLQSCRLNHTLLTRNSKTAEENQEEEEAFEVTLVTSLRLVSCPNEKKKKPLEFMIKYGPLISAFDDRV